MNLLRSNSNKKNNNNDKNNNNNTPNDLKKETLSQVLNLLRTNTQNIFHLESLNFPGAPPDNNTNNPLNQSTPIPSTGNPYHISPNVSNAIEKKDHTPSSGKKIHHKHSRSATTAADFRLAQEKAKELALKNNSNNINVSASITNDLLSIDWGRPRSYSEASGVSTIIDSDSPASSASSSTSSFSSPKKKGKREKRSSNKSLAPVMPFTTTPTRPRGNSLLDVDVEVEVEKGDTNSLIPLESCNEETLVALHALEKDGRKIKKKSNSQIITSQLNNPSLGGNGYFDKFMSEFYPHLPSPSSTPSTPSSSARPVTPNSAVVTEKESDDYHKLFALPANETILEKLKCAHRGKLIKQGKLIMTQNYICFYSPMFLNKKVLKFTEITNIRKATTAFLLADAVKIVTAHKKYYFGQFADRDTAFEIIVSRWVKCGAQLSPGIKEDLKNSISESDSPQQQVRRAEQMLHMQQMQQQQQQQMQIPTQTQTHPIQPLVRVRSPPTANSGNRRHRPISIRDLFGPEAGIDRNSLDMPNNNNDTFAFTVTTVDGSKGSSPNMSAASSFTDSANNSREGSPVYFHSHSATNSPSYVRIDNPGARSNSSPSFSTPDSNIPNPVVNNLPHVPLQRPHTSYTPNLFVSTEFNNPSEPSSGSTTPTVFFSNSTSAPSTPTSFESMPPPTFTPFSTNEELPPTNSIYTAYKFRPGFQSTRSRRVPNLFNENTVMSINKWLTEKATEDARYRSGRGVAFGKDLEQLHLCEKGDSSLSSVPSFVYDVLAYFQVAGVRIKRLFSQYVDPTEVQALRASVEAGRADFFVSSTNPKLLAALFVQFFRELPIPLISNFAIVICSEMDDPVYRKSCLRSFVYSLSFHHRNTLNSLISFFRVLGQHYSVNETTPHDLASIFGPILINKPDADLMFIAEAIKTLEHLMLDYNDVFPDKDNGAMYVMKRGFQVVKHITPDYLITKLADPYYGEYEDPDFVDIVVLTHNLYIMKTDELINKLISLYDSKSGPLLWKQRLRLRILEILTRVVPLLTPTSPGLGLGSREPPAVIAWFYSRHANSSSTKEESIMLDMLVKPKALPIMETILVKPKKIKAKYQPLDLATQDVACQIALLDMKHYKELPLEELMAKNFSKPERSPHFQAMVQLFNRWSMWVGTEIFSCPEIHARANAIEKIISVAEYLRHLKDYHGSYAIVAGLGHYTIARLHLTLEKVSKKAKQTLSGLQELFNSEANHKNYRDELQHAKPPYVPYLGLYSKDLFVVEENLGPNTIESTGMLNFEKMRSVYAALKAIKHLQTFAYPFPEVPALGKLMMEKTLLTEDEMDQKSREFEPRRPRPPPPPPS